MRKRNVNVNALTVRGGQPLSARAGKVRKEFWLNPNLLRRAQQDLGAATERETVEMALGLVSFRRELRAGARAVRRMKLSRID